MESSFPNGSPFFPYVITQGMDGKTTEVTTLLLIVRNHSHRALGAMRTYWRRCAGGRPLPLVGRALLSVQRSAVGAVRDAQCSVMLPTRARLVLSPCSCSGQDTAQGVTRYVHARVRQGGTGHRGPVPFYGMLS